ncbi:hypothetical protein AUK04_01170 [Candidatus Roizmanbacteria bacterium CG2_30_33_16]|uniref:Uncharacterized protein n=4 Tax=Candidatus Roizmaniibacteriota TaxID=1752723 RepID=A0A2H0C2Y9_9BACT|nr:MAG: hypothetical protein AUK04_01170 [Candidatus Roizmanbacteria bacterium CG2_30_33_16]PIP64109.1 MAG: hypothetical protein COW96_04380 [Candidatus Roizmanbacteria bacterium CG22_combo_CG10-13_8_21_14_all_33_16]PIX70753.1 MAG: hypothetical protein COZ39_04240 [Candidatus Roizmanbacteria bacterium CG_4_10_14_3_um_filter_33_21]PJB88271.1 MAG: hypothetical protein CO083_02635 [Candidatus Roizmanbacteria bacterium CG_4_9_14_0_8_um_filter_34_12]
MTNKEEDKIPDPLENFKELFNFIISVILKSIQTLFPIITIGFLAIVFLLYLLFKLLGIS